MHFSLIHCRNEKAIAGRLKSVVEWVLDPWHNQETTMPHTRFGWGAVTRRKDSWEVFTSIWDYVDQTNKMLKQIGAEIHAAIDDDQETDPEEPPAKLMRLTPTQWVRTPQSPPCPPPCIVPKPPQKPAPPQPSASPSSSLGLVAPITSPENPSVAPSARAKPLEQWQTRRFDLKHWVQTLELADVDKTSVQELFLLAQLGKEGAYEANRIISKILKKQADGVVLRNASAFVHAAVHGARNVMHIT